MQELGTAASREEDANCRLTDEELNFCAKALKKSKACGVDGIGKSGKSRIWGTGTYGVL